MNPSIQRLFGAAAAFAVLAAGCTAQGTDSGTSSASTEADTTADSTALVETETSEMTESTQETAADASKAEPDFDTLFSARDLSGSYDTPSAVILCSGNEVSIDGMGASADGSDITITDEGVYRITGVLDDGQIIVNSAGKVQLVLDGISLSCADSAPIYVQQAKKCFLTLADGSENTVSDGSTYAQEGNEPDAAIFSKDSLTINGSGTLTVTGNYNEGITSKDDIVITGGTLHITAVGNGIKGKDYVAFAGGTVTVTAGADGIKSDNTEDTSCGFVYIHDGNITVNAAEDGIQAETQFLADGGAVHVQRSYEGIEAANIRISGGSIEVTASDDGMNASDGTAQGGMGTYSAGASLEISGGSVYVNADGDGLDSNGDLLISGGTVIVDGASNSGNGAIDSNGELLCTGGLLIAAGCSGMAEYPSRTQKTAVITLDTMQAGGTEIRILGADGSEILTHTPAKAFNSLIVSSPEFADGTACTCIAGGTEIGSFTFTDTLAFLGDAGNMMGGGFRGSGRGDMGGGRGQRPDMQMPTDENGNPAMPGDMTPPQDGFGGRMPMDRQIS